MKSKNFTRQEIMELPEGIRIRMSIHSNCAPEYQDPGGRLILQTEELQEDDEELFGLYGDNWIGFNLKAEDMEIVDPIEITNPPLWVVAVEYFKEKKRNDDYYIASVLGKDQQVLFPAGWVQRDMMEGQEVRFFHAQLLAGNIKLVHAIHAPASEAEYEALIYKKPM